MKSKGLFMGFITACVMLCSNVVYAADVTGKWYGSPYGIDMVLMLNEDNTYTRIKGDTEEYGVWKLKDEKLVMDEGENVEMIFDYSDDKLFSDEDGIQYVFTRSKEPVKFSAKKENVTEKDFNGKWYVISITSGEVTAEPDVFFVKDISMVINDKDLTFNAESESIASRNIKNIKKEVEDGCLNFELNLVGGAVCTAKGEILENGNMKVNFKTEKENITMEFTKDDK